MGGLERNLGAVYFAFIEARKKPLQSAWNEEACANDERGGISKRLSGSAWQLSYL